ncbi:hypothetical protein HMPREF1861_00429 [Corynebacterium kroppenstedtii]|nr:hypothetical protein HMPREF1861_00429 [Corynebacterium kroppenstedtii]
MTSGSGVRSDSRARKTDTAISRPESHGRTAANRSPPSTMRTVVPVRPRMERYERVVRCREGMMRGN